jgi:hypothetical protein
MQKLLTAALLLVGCTLPQAHAQKAQVSPPTAVTAATSPTPPLHWAAAEFCEAYAQYYRTLPSLYRYNADQSLHITPLAAPNADVAALLLQQPALREAVYQTLYQYCHTLKYGLDNGSEVEDLVHQFLYRNLHMSDLAASYLAPQIARRYRQPAPPSLVEAATPATASNDSYTRRQANTTHTADPRGSLPAKALYGEPGSSRKKEQPRILYTPKGSGEPNASALYGEADSRPSSSSEPELSGWRFDTPPAVEAVDDNPGSVRFRIEVDDDGEVKSVTKTYGTVSPAQEKLCRDGLLNAHFVKTKAGASAATGFYTFRFTVR